MTCKWWDEIWLNEGFATLFEYLLVEHVRPELRMRDYFNVQIVHRAFQADALESTRPMYFAPEISAAISGLFDRIAYDKCKKKLRE